VTAPRRAAVNAFGFGGINAHAILEEYAGPETSGLLRTWDSELVIVAAESRASLLIEAERIARLALEAGVELVELARDLNLREHGASRLAVVATSPRDLAEKLIRALEKLKNEQCASIQDRDGVYYAAAPLAAEGKLAFIFPGEGSQYPNMLADLCMHFPGVRRVFDLMDRAFAGHHRGYLPSQVIFPPPAGVSQRESIWDMDVGAEAVFAASQALVALLNDFGIRPDAVVGHSTGEHSALLVSEVVKVENDEELIAHILEVNAVYTRQEALGKIPEAGLMAVGGGPPRCWASWWNGAPESYSSRWTIALIRPSFAVTRSG
jgi:acyl transferase domain-containing protein